MFAIKYKHSAPATRRLQPSRFGQVEHGVKAQQVDIHRILRSTGVQTKLTIGQPNDKYEQEADRIADKVMAMPDSKFQRQSVDEEEEETLQTKPLTGHITPLVQRQEELSEEEEEPVQAKFKGGDMLQRMNSEYEEETAQRQSSDNDEKTETLLRKKTAWDETPEISNGTANAIQLLKGNGRSLYGAERSFFEPRFGADFSEVRIHNDTRASDIARSINARAFTLGSDVVFGSGEYSSATSSGRKLLAHELTHVIQQQKNPQLHRKIIQRRYSKRKVNALYKLVNPQPPPPIIKRSITVLDVIVALLKLTNPAIKSLFGLPLINPGILKSMTIPQYELGPFRCWPYNNKKIYDARSVSPVINLTKKLKELYVEDDFNGRTIIKHHNFINIKLKQKPNSTVSDMMKYIFGFSKTPKGKIGAETTVFHPTTSSLNWEKWSNIGKITPAKSGNPFYDWAAMLHEQHHRETALTGFTNKVIAEVVKMKNKILTTPASQYQRINAPQIAAMKKQLKAKTDPEKIFKYMIRHPIIRFEAQPTLKPKIKALYSKWETYFSKIKNHAKEELASYCLSWKGIQNSIKFIKMALSHGKRQKRRRSKSP